MSDPIQQLQKDAEHAALKAGFEFDGRYGHWIKPHGRFECEPYWLPYYYDLVLSGMADSDALYLGEDCIADIFTLSPMEIAAFDFPPRAEFLLVTYSSAGFIGHQFCDAAELEVMRAAIAFLAHGRGEDNDA